MITTISTQTHAGPWNTKRSSDYFSRGRRSVKRHKVDCPLSSFSEDQRIILKGAAKILGVSISRLIAIATLFTPTSAQSVGEDDETPLSDIAEAHQPLFNLSLPEITNRRNRLQSPIEHTNNSLDPTSIPLNGSAVPATASVSLGSNMTILAAPLSMEQQAFDPSSAGPNEFSWGDFGLDDDWLQSLTSRGGPMSEAQETADTKAFHASTSALQELSYDQPPHSPVTQASFVSPYSNATHQQYSEPEPLQESRAIAPSFLAKGKGRRRGPFQDLEQRNQTTLTRRMGACIRCSMQRIRVSPPCFCSFGSR